ncbi:helix-turn-helix domain-containing protein [Fundidesulfovibrio terrae]|uniref:helix-turn-helix domain-containing protein n=1 Tax=Fundidesulfovibrio terrae TaxID=2922866 RepID=UPI001FAFD0C3
MLKEQLRRHLAQITPESDLARWFDPLDLHPLPDSLEIVVEFPHAYFGQWFDSQVKDHFEKQVSLYLGPGYVLRYRNREGATAGAQPSQPAFSAASIDFPFGHEFTFEQFFTNQKNLFPLASAREVAKSREVKFNPLVIQGDPGTGKTHLLRCMANEISKQLDKNFIFLGTLDDLAELYEAGPQDSPIAVRTHLTGYSCFFLDDLHRLGDYPNMAREVLILFNAFLDSKRQMAFSTAVPLASCEGIPLDLKTRLDGGLMVQLSKPDLDVRLKYVQDHCQRKKIALSKSQMLTLAQRHHDFRGLHGLMVKFQAFRELLKRDISEAIFENIMGRSLDEQTARTTPTVILEQVGRRFNLDAKTILGSKRTKDIVLARQVAMLLCREELGLSYPALGKLFGGKDHSTVLHAVKKIKKLQQDSNDTKDLVHALRKSCRQGGS